MKNTLILSLLLLAMNVHAQVPAYVAPGNLFGWYPFNGNANNAAPTVPPGLLNGTVNGATPTTDRFGSTNSAYQLNGDTDNITIDTPFFWVAWQNYTISCWVNSDTLDNPNNPNQAQAIFNTIPHHGVALYFNWGYFGKYGMYAAKNPAVASWDILPGKKSVASCTAHTWKHLVMKKKFDSLYSLYIDGDLDTTYKNLNVAIPYYCKLVLGRSDPGVISEGFFGKIDDYGIWNRALTECEIRRLYRATPYLYITSQPVDTAFSGSPVHFQITDTGAGNTYHWQGNCGAGFTNLTNAAPYSGVTTQTLTVAYGPSPTCKYRCVVTGAYCIDTSSYGNLIMGEGVKKTGGNSSVSISPNPTNGDFYITGADNAHVRIIDNTGRAVKKEINTGKVSIGTLPTGLYIIVLTDKDGTLLHRDKLLKQ